MERVCGRARLPRRRELARRRSGDRGGRSPRRGDGRERKAPRALVAEPVARGRVGAAPGTSCASRRPCGSVASAESASCARVRATDRQEVVRLREEAKVGIVCVGDGGRGARGGARPRRRRSRRRTIGRKPWRAAGLEFGDSSSRRTGRGRASAGVLDAIRAARRTRRSPSSSIRPTTGNRRRSRRPCLAARRRLTQSHAGGLQATEADRGDTEWSGTPRAHLVRVDDRGMAVASALAHPVRRRRRRQAGRGETK